MYSCLIELKAKSELRETRLMLNIKRLVCVMVVVLFASSMTVAQENKNNAKKPPKPFRWVNSLPKTGLPDGVKHGTFKSPSMEVDVGYCIYLPPSYEEKQNAERRYPVVYYLHG